jgi:hypothetical protein
MQNVVLSLLVNGMMTVMLIVTILYCWRLNGRIRLLQDSKSELATIIREFDESTRRATDSIAQIHEATARLSENMQHKIDKANFLADDLQYMIEKGSKLAGKTEPQMPTPRPSMPRPEAAPAPQGASKPAVEEALGSARRARMRSRAEQELMQVLGNKEESGR